VVLDEDFVLIVCLLLQVEIVQLENALSAARHRLGEMRKVSYQDED
jgi:hypothetical protein